MEAKFLEEQKTELEILQNIYLNEIEITKTTSPFSLSVTCKPFLDAWSLFDEDLETMYVKLHVDIPQRYPEEMPVFNMHSSLFAMNDERKFQFEKMVRHVMASLKGVPMLYDIVEAIRLHILNSCLGEKYKDLVPSYEEEKAEEESKIEFLTFTPVNKETFLVWKAKFDEEMAQFSVTQAQDTSNKLSGKEYFLQHQAEMEEGELEEDVEDFE